MAASPRAAQSPQAAKAPGAQSAQAPQPAKVEPPQGGDEDSDDSDDSQADIEGASDELQSAKAVEAKALSDEERLLRQRVEVSRTLGPANPLQGKVNDLSDLLPQADQDARDSKQIARELEKFETFDAGSAASHYDIPVELNDQVAQYIRMFQGPLRKHFVVWLSRSARYIPHMRDLLAKQGVPEDTVFLSLIESGFSSLAYSVARAAGSGSSCPRRASASGCGPTSGSTSGGTKATVAAAAYLKELRGQLGSWYLAWAGYNAGAGTLFKAIRRQHSSDFWTLIRGRVLRKETKGYVPKLIAAALIAKHPHAFGFDDVVYQEPMSSETVEIDEPTELSFVATAAGTDVQTLRDLNPALRRFCTPPAINGESYLLRVPVGTVDRVSAALKARPASQRLAFRYHRVKPGEGLGAVARQFGVPPEAIARMNGLHRQARCGPGAAPPGDPDLGRGRHRRQGRHRGRRARALQDAPGPGAQGAQGAERVGRLRRLPGPFRRGRGRVAGARRRAGDPHRRRQAPPVGAGRRHAARRRPALRGQRRGQPVLDRQLPRPLGGYPVQLEPHRRLGQPPPRSSPGRSCGCAGREARGRGPARGRRPAHRPRHRSRRRLRAPRRARTPCATATTSGASPSGCTSRSPI